MVKRGLSEAQLTRFLTILSARTEREHGGKLSTLAKEMGISQSGLWQIVHRKTTPSRGTVERLAQLEGVSVESILASPRDHAAELAREAGVPKPAIARVLAEPERAELRPVLWYVDRMRAYAVLDDDGGAGRTG